MNGASELIYFEMPKTPINESIVIKGESFWGCQKLFGEDTNPASSTNRNKLIQEFFKDVSKVETSMAFANLGYGYDPFENILKFSGKLTSLGAKTFLYTRSIVGVQFGGEGDPTKFDIDNNETGVFAEGTIPKIDIIVYIEGGENYSSTVAKWESKIFDILGVVEIDQIEFRTA